MVLVDTSVWVDHFRRGNARLAALLENGDVASHPFIIGELACGNLPERAATLGCLRDLPQAGLVGQDEAMRLIESRRLMGKGLGFVDIHILAAALIDGFSLWTLDLPLGKAAAKRGVAFL